MHSTMPADIPKVWDEVFSFANTAHTHTHQTAVYPKNRFAYNGEANDIFFDGAVMVVVVWPQHDKRTQTTQ